MFIVYILHSSSLSRYYIGHTESMASRLILHNSGKVRSTKTGIPWLLVYTEHYKTRLEAYARERQIKRFKGGKAFKKLVKK
jgi:putative endonuclease